MLKEKLNKEKEMQKQLYVRGFLVTDDESISVEGYPFYNNWTITKIDKYRFFINEKAKLHVQTVADEKCFLIGHAYNPFRNLYDENEILSLVLSDSLNRFSLISELTGNFLIGFIRKEVLSFIGDATCMQACFYGCVNKKVYLSSHSQLIGDICNLQFDDFVSELINYKYYHLFGRMLPGDLSPYKSIKRLVPNFQIIYKNCNFEKRRLYPMDKAIIDINYSSIVKECGDILLSSLDLIPKKWKKPAISLTGGCDSKTTLSCVGNFDDYKYFSYISVEKEAVDAEAAKRISDILNLKHTVYNIPQENNDFHNYSLHEEILSYNCGNIGKNNQNDIRKRIYFLTNNDFDVEVKSWVSEVARAYYHKRFSKNKLPNQITPRILTTLYKVFLDNRSLVKKVDEVFLEYLNEYYSDEIFERIPWYDIIFWEYRLAAWNGLVITGEHSYSFDITIPYNNRRLIDLMLRTPLENRINDQLHSDIRKMFNDKVYNIGVNVTNVEHTKFRATMEGLYFDVHSRLPF